MNFIGSLKKTILPFLEIMKDLKILQFRFLRVCVENVVSRETICLTGTTFVLHVARAIFNYLQHYTPPM